MKRLPYTWFQRIALILSITMVLWMFLYLIFHWQSLPDRIPTHFGISGEADAWGGKNFLWFMPFFSGAMFLLMAVVTHFPACWNVSASVNDRNRNFVYRQTKNMLCALNFSITLMSFYIQLCTVKASSLHGGFLPVILIAFIGGPLVWIVYISRKAKAM